MAKAKNKTVQTEASVDDYIAAVEDEKRRSDCHKLVKLMSSVTKQPPKMWGTGIVGFGTCHYKYESGREGDMPLAGFASRNGDLSIYLSCDQPPQQDLLEKLGRHKMGKACLYVRRLDDVDMKVLKKLVQVSVKATKDRY